MQDEELLGVSMGDVALIAKESTEQAAHEPRHRPPVVDIAQRQAEGHELAAVVDHQMELEAVEPAD